MVFSYLTASGPSPALNVCSLFHYDYSTTDYEQLMNDLAQRLNVPVINNRLVFPEAVASGSLNFVLLPNGAHVNIVNCKVNTELAVMPPEDKGALLYAPFS